VDEQGGSVVKPAAAAGAGEVLQVQVHQAADARRARCGHLDPLLRLRAREGGPQRELVEVDVRRCAAERRGDRVDETIRAGALVRQTGRCPHEVKVAETCFVRPSFGGAAVGKRWRVKERRVKEQSVSTRYDGNASTKVTRNGTYHGGQ
jgi:hypothetical protein